MNKYLWKQNIREAKRIKGARMTKAELGMILTNKIRMGRLMKELAGKSLIG